MTKIKICADCKRRFTTSYCADCEDNLGENCYCEKCGGGCNESPIIKGFIFR